MAMVFWDSRDLLLIDYWEKGMNITEEYYISLLDQLKSDIQVKHINLAKKKNALSLP